MSYSKQTWDTTSYVTPTRMNHIEDGIESVDTKTANDIDYVSGTTIKSKIDTIDNTISTISTTVTDVSTVVLTDLGDNYYAQKCGKLVTLFTGVITSVTATAQGWYLLKTLPQGLRPSGTRYFTAIDYTVGTQADNYPLDMKLENDGELYVYIFSGHLTVLPYFTVTYMV